MTVTIIAAVARNRAIGFQNKLLYWLPNDMKRFKALTSGHTVIMGRNTYLSLPKGALPNRRNVVLSSVYGNASADEKAVRFPHCDVYVSLEAALRSCQADEEVYIIGGARVYEQALPFANRLCLTEIDDTPESADAFFPDYSGWRIEKKEAHPQDERHAFSYAFVDYVKGEGDSSL